MASSFVVTIGGKEIDSNKCYVEGECVDIFTPEDRIVIDRDESKYFLYRAKIPLLISRLECMGFTLDNCREAFRDLVEEIDSDVGLVLEDEDKDSLSDYEKKYLEFQKYIHNIEIGNIIELLMLCKEFEHSYYPDLGKHNLTKNELILINVLFNRGFFSQMFDEIYFHPFNIYRLLAEVFTEEDEFVIDYSDLVYAGYYGEKELPIETGYNSIVKNKISNALIKGQYLDDEENRQIEYKEVSSNNPVSSIKKAFPKYVIGFLNAEGGSVLWGIKDNREVAGVRLGYENRDRLRRELYSSLDDIEPSVVKELFQLEFRPVVHDGSALENTVCVELIIPRGEQKHMYFTKSGKTWVRFNGITKELKGLELYKHITHRGSLNLF